LIARRAGCYGVAVPLTVHTRDAVVVAEPTGAIGGRAATELESRMQEQFVAGVRQIVVDFTSVDGVAADGLRVLMLLNEELQAVGGRLVLCGLDEHVRRVFEFSALHERFLIVTSITDAMTELSGVAAPPAASSGSTLGRLVGRLLDAPVAESPGHPSAKHSPSELRRLVGALLADD